MNQSLEDIDFLARSEHRVKVLDALAERPHSRADLRVLTGASSSTIGRMLREFDERHWIVRDGHRYKVTQLGAFVTKGVTNLIDRMETERVLRDVMPWLPAEASGFTIEMVADAVVTVADPADPYRPVNRFLSLLRETDRFRFVGFDVALIGPYMDEICQLILDGMHTEVIHPSEVSRKICSTYPKQAAEALESEYFTLWWHDNLPSYGVGIFDDRIEIGGCDPTSGVLQVMIDTDAPETCEWAEDLYESYRREAHPFRS